MTELNQVYKCNSCGNIIEVLHSGAGTLVCCGQPMELLQARVEDESKEKHVPIIKKLKTKIRISTFKPHPMLEDHYIEWIEIIVDGKIYRQFLKPGDKPRAEFCVIGENIQARLYCNIHSLWKSI